MAERLDNTGFGQLKIYQDEERFCYGIDAVLVADFAAGIINGRKVRDVAVADLGSGTGIIPLILSHKTEARKIVGVEIQEQEFKLGMRNIEINNLEDRVFFLNANIKDIKSDETVGIFDAVVSNPPYTAENSGIESRNQAKAIARHEIYGSLEDFISTASHLLRDKGDFFMVHRPNRIVDICQLCREHSLEPKTMRFVSGHEGDAPNILLVHCVKGGGRQLKILPPLVVYEEKGLYTREINEIYEK